MKIKEKEFESILQDLKQIAQELGAKVRFERGDFKGGYCIVKEDKTIVINKLSTLQKKVMILTSALKDLGVDEKYLPPRIREIIEEIAEK
jgi:mRNA-degrading endonuclease RelE of RelBE toxin-antitoxin system